MTSIASAFEWHGLIANFKQWVRYALLRRGEAAALAVSMDPRCSNATLPAELRDQLWDVQMLIERAQIAGELGEWISPIDFVEWARSNKLALPKDLVEAVEVLPTPRLSLRGLRSENDELKVEIQRLKSANDQLNKERRLHPRRATTLELIAYSYAVKLGYEPGTRNPAARLMSDELTRLGIGRGPDILREILDEANETAKAEQA
jgi:hypothetical protein